MGTGDGRLLESEDEGERWSPVPAHLPSGPIRTLAIDPVDPETIYAGVSRAGIFKSGDGGSTWRTMNTGLAGLEVRAFPSTEVSSGGPAGANGGGVFKSSNGGGTWKNVSKGLDNRVIRAVVVDPLVPRTLFVATSTSGIFKSIDGGTTWNAVNTGLDDRIVRSLAIDPQKTSRHPLRRLRRRRRREDQRRRRALADDETRHDPGVATIVVDPKRRETVYVGTADGGVFKSTTGAEHRLSTSATGVGSSSVPSGCRRSCSTYALAVSLAIAPHPCALLSPLSSTT